MLRTDQTVGSSVTNARVVTVSGVTWTSFMFPCFRVGVTWRGGIASDWVTQRSMFWQKHLGLMYSQATVRSYTRGRVCCVGTTPLKEERYKVDKKPTHRSSSCGNLHRPHRTKTSTVWCCLLSAGCRLFGERIHRETCISFVVERVPPQGAPYMEAQRYQAVGT